MEGSNTKSNVENMRNEFNNAITNKELNFNSVSLTREKYNQIIGELTKIKMVGKKETPRDYSITKRYDILNIGGIEKLIVPLTGDKPNIRFYAHQEEIFDIIHEAHTRIGHRGRDITMKTVNKKYKNVTLADISTYLSLCRVCLNRKMTEKKKNALINADTEKMDSAFSSSLGNIIKSWVNLDSQKELEDVIDIKEEVDVEYDHLNYDAEPASHNVENCNDLGHAEITDIQERNLERLSSVISNESTEIERQNQSDSIDHRNKINCNREISRTKTFNFGRVSKPISAKAWSRKQVELIQNGENIVDATDSFFQGISIIVKTFPPEFIVEARLKIFSIIGEIQKKALEMEHNQLNGDYSK